MTLEADILAAFPAEVRIPARLVADAVAASNAETPRMLIVLDDDPTGTQSVADLPVLTRWEVKDFTWAFGQAKPAVYVLTNTRSLDPAEAAARNEEVVRNALAAAGPADASTGSGIRLGFVSPRDPHPRGPYPPEPAAINHPLPAAHGPGLAAVMAFGSKARGRSGPSKFTQLVGGRLWWMKAAGPKKPSLEISRS